MKTLYKKEMDSTVNRYIMDQKYKLLSYLNVSIH